MTSSWYLVQSFLDCLPPDSLAPCGLLHLTASSGPGHLLFPPTRVGLDPDREWSDSLDVYIYLCVSPSFQSQCTWFRITYFINTLFGRHMEMHVGKATFSWIMMVCISISHGRGCGSSGFMYWMFWFYLLDFYCNHVIQKPGVRMHLGAHVLLKLTRAPVAQHRECVRNTSLPPALCWET